MSSPAGIYNIVADQGATFQRTITWQDSNGTPINLTGYTARMQVRRRPSDGEALVSLTTENGRITLGGSAGTIALNCPASEMDFVDGKWAYDLEVQSASGVVTRIVMGSFLLRAEVTR